MAGIFLTLHGRIENNFGQGKCSPFGMKMDEQILELGTYEIREKHRTSHILGARHDCD